MLARSMQHLAIALTQGSETRSKPYQLLSKPVLQLRSKLSERHVNEKRPRPGGAVQSYPPGLRTRRTIMDEYECGCSQATSINELCPKCRADYEEYLRVMAMLQQSVAKSGPREVKHGDAA
jgi:hypothetical protein